jgi:hypothetical protein
MHKVQLGLGLGTFNSTIRFDGDRDVDVDMSTVSFSGAWLINETWTLRGAMGVILGGELKPLDEVVHKVDTGGLAAVGVERRVLTGEGSTPFIDMSLFLGASWTKTLDPDTKTKTSYMATDARLGARAGWSINGNTFPYVAARVFGGPVKWELAGEDVTGTDVHHYQLALGTAVQLGPLGFYAEWAGLGEKAVSAGITTSW